VAPVVVDHEITELLIGTRWLPRDLSEDRQEIGKAITALLRDAAAHEKL
jgi:hypothetical protein